MKNRIIIMLLILCFGWTNTYAQNDAEAEKILATIAAKYKAFKTAKIDLKLIIDIPETKEDVISNGVAWLKKDMYKIEFEERMQVSNTITQWTYLKEVNEVQISKYDASSITFLPSKIFDVYSEDYIYRVKEEYRNEKKEMVKVIELTPINKELGVFKIVVSINTDKMELVKSQIFERSGMKIAYEILSLKTNLELKDDFFTFDPEAFGIEKDDITDLR